MRRKNGSFARKLSPALKATALALAATLALSGCGFGDDLEPASPALWLVSNGDAQIYLLGSMHALPRAMQWDDGPVATAMRQSTMLVMELTPAEAAKAGDIFTELSPRERPITLEQRLPADALAALQKRPKSERALFSDDLEDWAIMLLLGQSVARDANLKTKFGVETSLSAYFKNEGKSVMGLETARSQLMIFETLPLATQRRLLSNALLKSGTAAEDVKALLDAWAKGDVAALAARINEDVESVPEAYKSLISDRNIRWADWSAERLSQPGTTLIAVGAGHMVGEQGLPALLQERGYKVERLQ